MMIRSLVFSALAITVAGTNLAYCDDVIITLDYSFDDPIVPGEFPEGSGTWKLIAEVVDTEGDANGSFGVAAVRALIDNIDPDVTFAPDIGTVFPVDMEGEPRPPVLMTEGGTFDIVYGQDLTESEGRMVVPGIGVGEPTLIASGTFPAGTVPDFGDDDSGLTSSALFLDSDSSPFGLAVDPDNVILNVDYPCEEADFNGDGFVGNGDLVELLTAWGGVPGPNWINNPPEFVGNDSLTDLLSCWGVVNPGLIIPLQAHSATVPEPNTLALTLIVGLTMLSSSHRS